MWLILLKIFFVKRRKIIIKFVIIIIHSIIITFLKRKFLQFNCLITYFCLCVQAVARNMEIRCKCHGVSGSCELKTCWRAAPEFRTVGAILKERFRESLMVEESNQGGSHLSIREKKRRRGRKRRKKKKKKKRRNRIKNIAENIFYYEKSPSFCEKDVNLEVHGTVGRVCNRSSRGVDSCSSLCCGRGYNIIRRRRTDRCNCKFHWCCYVTCKNCTVDEWITVCKWF